MNLTGWTLAAATVGAVAILMTIAFPWILVGSISARLARKVPDSQPDKDQAEILSWSRNSALQAWTSTLLALGAIGTVGTLYFTARSVEATQASVEAANESNITDRYSRAVEQLSSGDVGVRVGGIYALRRLTVDSQRDEATIIAVLSAFLKARQASISSEDLDRSENALLDVQAAGATIAQRNVATDRQHPGQRLDLSNVLLEDAELNGTIFNRADLSGSNLVGIQFDGAYLNETDLGGEGTNLSGAHLNDAHLAKSCLGGTNFEAAKLRGADLAGADLSQLSENPRRTNSQTNLVGTDLTGANLTNANLKGVDLSETKGLNAKQVEVAVFDNRTMFPPALRRKLPRISANTYSAQSPCG
jgi:uncharacterized protein YjbI with pentapeptide repeats